MKASTKRTLGLLGSMALLIAALAAYINFIKPSYNAAQQLRGELAAKKDLYARQQVIITRTKNLLAQFKNAAELQNTISLALPPDESVTSLLRQINGMTKFAGVKLENFSTSILPLKTNNLGSIRTTFQVSGTYGAVKTLLRSLETNVRVMDLKSFRLDPAGLKPNEDRFSFLIVVDAHYQK